MCVCKKVKDVRRFFRFPLINMRWRGVKEDVGHTHRYSPYHRIYLSPGRYDRRRDHQEPAGREEGGRGIDALSANQNIGSISIPRIRPPYARDPSSLPSFLWIQL